MCTSYRRPRKRGRRFFDPFRVEWTGVGLTPGAASACGCLAPVYFLTALQAEYAYGQDSTEFVRSLGLIRSAGSVTDPVSPRTS